MTTRFLWLAFLGVEFCSALPAGVLYVDCAGGDDGRDGRSEDTAIRTVAAVNRRTFAPGDTILLKRGARCSGMFAPAGSGTAESPITLGAYGSGPAPVIDGGGAFSAIRLHNQQGWHIENIEATGGARYGIRIGADGAALRHFRITNVAVHDVNGPLSSKDSGLIVFGGARSEAVFSFDDVVIDGATAWNTTQWAGIEVIGANYTGNMDGPHGRDITIRNSIVHDVYGDGIVLFLCQNGLIERCAAWRTGQQPTETIGTPNAIWTWMCNECLVQFSESWLSSSPGVDGGAFDIDWGNRNNTVQHNYGHDGKGYCVSVFGAGGMVTANSAVRNNVCLNNGRDAAMARRQGDIFLSTWEKGKLSGVAIHDNVSYWSPAADAPALNNSAEFAGAAPAVFERNSVISQVSSLILSNASLRLNRNRYWTPNAGAARFQYAGREFTDFATYRAASGQDQEGTFAAPPPRAASEPPGRMDRESVGDAEGSYALLAFLDASDDSHGQSVVLRSMQAQYRERGLQVRVIGTPDPNWALDGIPVRAAKGAAPPAGVRAKPTTFLVAPDRGIIGRWAGFAPAQDLGLAIERRLGNRLPREARARQR
jgi:hypothetical protein